MGGRGSGRRKSGAAGPTTAAVLSIDVREFDRRRLFVPEPDQEDEDDWICEAPLSDGFYARCWADRVIVITGCKPGPPDWTRPHHHITVVATPCHLGGARHWFICPEPGCGRRVAILYLRQRFACRICHGLGYPSQRQCARDRAITRARALRRQLGWSGTILDPPQWTKPKGMHWRSYWRLVEDYASVIKRLAGAVKDSLEKSGRPPS